MIDVIIIGSGPAGFTAAIYCSRGGLSTLVVCGPHKGGQLLTTTLVENFPGFPEGIDGFELMQNMEKQAKRFGTGVVEDTVTNLEKKDGIFSVTLSRLGEFQAKAVIIASGAVARKLEFKGAAEFWQKGISACAVCDGALPMFRGEPVAVIGGGDSAMEEALHLARFASRVFIIHRRDTLRASDIMVKRVRENLKIEILYNSEVVEVGGDEVLRYAILKNGNQLRVSGLFYAIGHEPASNFLKMGTRSETGHVTSVPDGAFVAGDVHDSRYRQAITAAGDGCKAALDVIEYLRN